MRDPVETDDPVGDAANLRLLLAFSGGKIDELVIDDLVSLLRSDHFIQPTLRDHLAAALVGEHDSIRATIARKKTGPVPDHHPVLGQALAQLDMIRIGKWIEDHPFTQIKAESGVEAAKAEFGISRREAYAARKAWRAAKASLSGK